MTSNLLILGLDATGILLHLVNFVILLVAVGFLVYKPMIRLIHERRETCRKNIEEHEEKLKEAAAVKAEYEGKIADAEKEIAALRAEADEEIAVRKEQALADARKQADRLVEQANAEIATEKINAVQAMRSEIVDAAVMIASGILSKEISAQEDRKIIDACLEEWSQNE